MTPNDLILYILDGEGGNEVSTIDLVNEFVATLLDENPSSTFGRNLAEEIKEFAINKGRCPNCGSRIIYKKVGGNESEYFGLPVSEEIFEQYCEDCGYKED